MAELTPAQLIERLHRNLRQEVQNSGSGQMRQLTIDMQDVAKKTPQAARNAVNSAARFARTTLINSIHQKVNLTKTQVRNRTTLRLAGPRFFPGSNVVLGTSAEASVIVGGTERVTERSKGETRTRSELKGQRISLFEFGRPRWKPGDPRGAAVQISRTLTTFIGPIAGRTVGKGFIRQLKSGKQAVLARSIRSEGFGSIPLVREGATLRADKRFFLGRRKGRLPLVLLRGPSVPGVLQGNQELIASAERLSKERILEQLLKQ